MQWLLITALLVNASGLVEQDQVDPSTNNREWIGGRKWHHWDRALGDIAGWRPALEERGFTIAGSYIFDHSKVESGGVRRKETGRSLLNVELFIDLGQVLELPGGTLYGRFESQAGRNASETVGDAQSFSNIDSDHDRQLTELWYQHVCLDGKLRFKIGKVDANTEFAVVENGLDFINSSMAYSPTILGFPTYPDPATSINVFFQPNESLTFSAGLYDGALQEGVRTGRRGAKTFYDDPSDLFLVTESSYRWSIDERPGRVSVGVWHHTGHFTKFNTGGRTSGTEGVFAVLEQVCWRDDDAREIAAFVQVGTAEQAVATIKRHVGFGVVGRGLIPMRPQDSVGFGATQVNFSDHNGAGFTKEYEAAYELYYRAQMMPWLSVQPDLQWIDNPGGMGVDDAWVATMRAVLDF